MNSINSKDVLDHVVRGILDDFASQLDINLQFGRLIQEKGSTMTFEENDGFNVKNKTIEYIGVTFGNLQTVISPTQSEDYWDENGSVQIDFHIARKHFPKFEELIAAFKNRLAVIETHFYGVTTVVTEADPDNGIEEVTKTDYWEAQLTSYPETYGNTFNIIGTDKYEYCSIIVNFQLLKNLISSNRSKWYLTDYTNVQVLANSGNQLYVTEDTIKYQIPTLAKGNVYSQDNKPLAKIKHARVGVIPGQGTETYSFSCYLSRPEINPLLVDMYNDRYDRSNIMGTPYALVIERPYGEVLEAILVYVKEMVITEDVGSSITLDITLSTRDIDSQLGNIIDSTTPITSPVSELTRSGDSTNNRAVILDKRLAKRKRY